MPNPKIKSVLVLGAGPIVIGQACEFDYSGTQACQALKQEGIRTVLLNSNPATIMTDPGVADATYIEAVDPTSAAAIIAKEKIDAVLPTMGGQTALNCALELSRLGIVAPGPTPPGQKTGPKKAQRKPHLIGANAESIFKAEDRRAFKHAMEKIGLKCADSAVASTLAQAQSAQENIGYPVIVRPSFTLGGAGGGIAYNMQEFIQRVTRGLAESPNGTVLLERSLIGWKEFEMEVVRDKNDNCIIVCAIENIDPMGVHTGDSITVAPALTLTDKEYQRMRDASIAVLREIGVDTGGANVQFAVNPKDGDMTVIEMNPRVSRSSALASKATGFPIAKVATRLALGYTLDEIKNDITAAAALPASFEPSIDYIVTKIPRFDFAKFAPAEDRLTTQMRSVGEVMAIARTFPQSLQKALRGLDIGKAGLETVLLPSHRTAELYALTAAENQAQREKITPLLSTPHSMRIFTVGDALRLGMTVPEIARITAIDPWFLHEIDTIIAAERDEIRPQLKKLKPAQTPPPAALRRWKQLGFSDQHIARFLPKATPPATPKATPSTPAPETPEQTIRRWRHQQNLHPVYKRIDSCAGEFPTETSYLYSTYESEDGECELTPATPTTPAGQPAKKIIILGSGPNRIGQGIEFDYCCVHGVQALKAAACETIMVNCNPETVSTDYDTADRLFFEPLTAEDVLEIIRRENPTGVIVQFGGQTPLSLAHALHAAGAPIIGTAVSSIDAAESRQQFKQIIADCALLQPPNAIITPSKEDPQALLSTARRIGYPLVVRPSYVLGGRAMEIVYSEDSLKNYLQRNLPRLSEISAGGDILLDKFLKDAVEVDVDAVRDAEGACLVAGVMEHVERAGIHSGDSACSLPPYSLPAKIVTALKAQTRTLAARLNVIGLINIQFAISGSRIYVLEVNPRASRTVPFISKATSLPIAKIAAKAMAGITLAQQGVSGQKLNPPPPPYFAVKEAVFPFNKFPHVDILLGPEMKSTGESMGLGRDFAAAYYLAQEAISPLPLSGVVLFSVRDEDKPAAAACAKKFANIGFTITATRGTAAHFTAAGLRAKVLNKVAEGRPHIVDAIKSGEIQIVINTETDSPASREDSFAIRRAALTGKVIYFTTMAATDALANGLQNIRASGARPPVMSLRDWYRLLPKNPPQTPPKKKGT